MNSRFGVFATAAVVTFLAGTASAQQGVKLQFNAGQVTLSAQNAPVRAILQEWARLGGATIVNGDRVTGPPVTLELTAVPERQALDIVLRSVAGYIVAPRPAGSQGGVSAFDRIVILPTSSAPRAPVPAATAAGRQPVIRPGIIRPPDQVDPGVENGDPLEDPGALIQGRDPRVVQPPFVGRPPVGADVDTDIVMEEGQKEDPTAPAGVAPTPGNPFGVPAGSSTTPGVISPPVPNVRTPQPQQRPNTNRVQ
jgi:hypothetical protein